MVSLLLNGNKGYSCGEPVMYGFDLVAYGVILTAGGFEVVNDVDCVWNDNAIEV